MLRYWKPDRMHESERSFLFGLCDKHFKITEKYFWSFLIWFNAAMHIDSVPNISRYFWSSCLCSAGPAFWGLINPQWNMCSKGRRQSPINVEPEKLLFDPYLRPLHIDKHKVSEHVLSSIRDNRNEEYLVIFHEAISYTSMLLWHGCNCNRKWLRFRNKSQWKIK